MAGKGGTVFFESSSLSSEPSMTSYSPISALLTNKATDPPTNAKCQITTDGSGQVTSIKGDFILYLLQAVENWDFWRRCSVSWEIETRKRWAFQTSAQEFNWARIPRTGGHGGVNCDGYCWYKARKLLYVDRILSRPCQTGERVGYQACFYYLQSLLTSRTKRLLCG